MIDRRRFLAASSAALAAPAFPALVRAQGSLTTIHAGGSPNDDMTALVYGVQAGIYRRAGLDVIVEKSTSGSAVASAVASGAYDIGKSSTASIFDAHQKGVPFTLIANAAIYDSKVPYGGFLLGKDTTLKSGKDAEGQIVACASLGSIGRVAFAAWVDQNGGDSKAVKFVELPFPAVPAALDAKRIFAGETGQPTQYASSVAGYHFMPGYDAIAKQFAVAVWYTTKDFSSKHPDALKAFVKATYEAGRYANAHPAETVKLMSDFTGVSMDIMQKVPRVALGTSLVLSEVQSAIDAAAKYGVLAHGFPARELADPNVL